METEYIGGNYLVNGLGGGGFRLQPSPITTFNQNPSLKGGADNTGGYSSVAEYLIGGNTFAVPSYAFFSGKNTPLSGGNEVVNNDHVSVVDNDIYDTLLDLAKEKDDTTVNGNSGTKKRKNKMRHSHTRKKYANNVNVNNSKNNRTRRHPK